jgi:hypothetical protein
MSLVVAELADVAEYGRPGHLPSPVALVVLPLPYVLSPILFKRSFCHIALLVRHAPVAMSYTVTKRSLVHSECPIYRHSDAL